MVKVLLLLAVIVVLAAVWFRLKRSPGPGAGAHTVDGRSAHASKLAAEQAHIARQGGQGMGQGGVGGGMGG